MKSKLRSGKVKQPGPRRKIGSLSWGEAEATSAPLLFLVLRVTTHNLLRERISEPSPILSRLFTSFAKVETPPPSLPGILLIETTGPVVIEFFTKCRHHLLKRDGIRNFHTCQ